MKEQCFIVAAIETDLWITANHPHTRCKSLSGQSKNKIKKFHPHINAYTIREYGGCHDDLDIKDPSDGGLGDYVVCYFEIKEALKKILETHDELGV